MSNKIRCAIKRPGEDVEIADIDNTLETLQGIVGGYIESVTVCSDLVIICNENGRLLGLEPNCRICSLDFVGTIIVCGFDADEFADLPSEAALDFIFTRKKVHRNDDVRK